MRRIRRLIEALRLMRNDPNLLSLVLYLGKSETKESYNLYSFSMNVIHNDKGLA